MEEGSEISDAVENDTGVEYDNMRLKITDTPPVTNKKGKKKATTSFIIST